MTVAEMMKTLEKAFEKMPQNAEVLARANTEFNPIEDALVMHIEIAFPATRPHD